jgi:hypothetical protein
MPTAASAASAAAALATSSSTRRRMPSRRCDRAPGFRAPAPGPGGRRRAAGTARRPRRCGGAAAPRRTLGSAPAGRADAQAAPRRRAGGPVARAAECGPRRADCRRRGRDRPTGAEGPCASVMIVRRTGSVGTAIHGSCRHMERRTADATGSDTARWSAHPRPRLTHSPSVGDHQPASGAAHGVADLIDTGIHRREHRHRILEDHLVRMLRRHGREQPQHAPPSARGAKRLRSARLAIQPADNCTSDACH